jgi:hypothetical protein
MADRFNTTPLRITSSDVTVGGAAMQLGTAARSADSAAPVQGGSG